MAVVGAVVLVATSLGLLPASLDAVSTDDSAAVSTPVVDPYYPEKGSALVDALHYDLQLRWTAQLARSFVAGRTSGCGSPATADRLRLDLSRRLRVSKVRLDGDAMGWSRPRGNKLVVSTPPLVADTRHSLIGGLPRTSRPGGSADQAQRHPLGRVDQHPRGWHVDDAGAVRRVHLVPGERPPL